MPSETRNGGQRDVAPGAPHATPAATSRYRERFENESGREFYRNAPGGLTVSSLGLGTYLGENTDEEDRAYEAVIRCALGQGINFIDTAINYRCQRSERAVGAAIQAAVAAGEIERQAVVVCSKGGYVPLESVPPASREAYQAYVKREFVDSEVLRPDELVAGGHSLAPRFIRYCIAMSRQNLGLRTIDLYYLHNPEQQLSAVDRTELLARLRAAFAVLEDAVARGDVGAYGCATWQGLRVPPGAPEHVSLEELSAVAHDVAGDDHHFKAVQLPINLAMPEAVRVPTQPLRGKMVTALQAADALGVSVIASASLMQGKLTSGLPETIRELFPAADTDAQRASTFVRTLPGVTSALVGTRNVSHLLEHLVAARTSG